MYSLQFAFYFVQVWSQVVECFVSRTRTGTEPLALEEPVLTEREEDSERGDQQGDRHVDQGVALSEEAKKLGNMMSRSFEDWQRKFEERFKLQLEHADKNVRMP